MELIIDGGLLPANRVESLLTEANELTAIFFTARRTTQRTNPKS